MIVASVCLPSDPLSQRLPSYLGFSYFGLGGLSSWLLQQSAAAAPYLCCGVAPLGRTPAQSHEIKRCLLLGRKAMTNLDSILKSRDITLTTKVHLVKAMVFPLVMYGCESWTVKKAERQRIDAFEQ